MKFQEMIEKEEKEVEVKKRKAYFVRYVSDGRRNIVSHTSSAGGKYHFSDGVWIEVTEQDARKYKADAKANKTWEYKEDYVIEKTSHHYARFLGVPGKKAAKFAMYDKDQNGNPIEDTKREYFFPKNTWVILYDTLESSDVAVMQRKAQANAHWEFETIELPTTVNAPIQIEGQSPQQYALEIQQKIEETEEETEEGEE